MTSGAERAVRRTGGSDSSTSRTCPTYITSPAELATTLLELAADASNCRN